MKNIWKEISHSPSDILICKYRYIQYKDNKELKIKISTSPAKKEANAPVIPINIKNFMHVVE